MIVCKVCRKPVGKEGVEIGKAPTWWTVHPECAETMEKETTEHERKGRE